MKAWPFILLTVLVLAGCGHRDPIDRIVKEESANGFFPSGMYTLIQLPATASPAQVASAAASQQGLSITNILEIRQVKIHADIGLPPELVNYTAVLAGTGSGRKVILLQYEKIGKGVPSGWWSRVYGL